MPDDPSTPDLTRRLPPVDVLASTAVVLTAETVSVGDYPIRHIAQLLDEYGGELAAVVERLECDGWSPAEIVAGVAQHQLGQVRS